MHTNFSVFSVKKNQEKKTLVYSFACEQERNAKVNEAKIKSIKCKVCVVVYASYKKKWNFHLIWFSFEYFNHRTITAMNATHTQQNKNTRNILKMKNVGKIIYIPFKNSGCSHIFRSFLVHSILKAYSYVYQQSFKSTKITR